MWWCRQVAILATRVPYVARRRASGEGMGKAVLTWAGGYIIINTNGIYKSGTREKYIIPYPSRLHACIQIRKNT